ncbi:hypothetical protein [Archangium violaceum]|uniref:hypothetical protein n=1 Tax=Archangium violaceum TaxID=83451 RepID=UPI0037C07AEF
MMKACALAILAAMLWGCAVPTSAWKGEVQWPDEDSAQLLIPSFEAGAALAAAGAIREMVRSNPFPHLFAGCSSPEQGLNAAVFTGPTPGLYYVKIIQRFDRCGGPYVRVLDGWYLYAVTPQGEVVAEAPYPPEEDTSAAPSPTPPPGQTPPPAAPPPSTGADTPAPAAPPPAEPSPTSPPPASPEPGPAGPALP